MARDPQTQALIDRLEASRRRLGGEVVALKARLNVPAQIKRQVARRPWAWFGASAGVGLIASRLLRRPRRDKRRKGVVRFLAPTLLTLAKPWLKTLLLREIQRRFVHTSSIPSNSKDSGTRFPLSKP